MLMTLKPSYLLSLNQDTVSMLFIAQTQEDTKARDVHGLTSSFNADYVTSAGRRAASILSQS